MTVNFPDATATAGANGSASLYTNPAAGAAPAKNELDSQAFLNLLVAQLRFQDPSSPMDTNQMMAQTTQLASMEQLTALNTTSQESFALSMRNNAANLVGKTVSYTDADGNEAHGLVTSVKYEGAVPTVLVNGIAIPLDAVASVTTGTPDAPAPTDPDADAGEPGSTPAGGDTAGGAGSGESAPDVSGTQDI